VKVLGECFIIIIIIIIIIVVVLSGVD
jgi:hypothetical protein